MSFKILGAIALLGALVILAYLGWFSWATCASCQFGNPSRWEEVRSPEHNLSFRYPSDFDRIDPTDPYVDPISIVLPGERGETALFQVGTWKPTPLPKDLSQAADRFAENLRKGVRSYERQRQTIDGHEAVTFLVEETSGRRVIETFLWDPIVTDVPDDSSLLAEGEVREVSLQLAKKATPIQRALYENVYREILSSLRFHNQTPAQGMPKGIPSGWLRYDDRDLGLSLWYPPEWIVESRTEEDGKRVAAFRSPPSPKTGEETTYTVTAYPQTMPLRIGELEAEVGEPFRKTATEGTLEEERVTFRGIGFGISFEARQPIFEKESGANGERKDRLEHLFLFKTGEDPFGKGRGYIVRVRFVDDKAQETRLRETRAMTRTISLSP
jgi:hypothetical protein